MKKIFSLFLLSFFLVSLISTPGYGQKVSDILEKMIKARGGRTALKNVKDITITGTMEMIAMGMSGSIALYQKEPDKMRWDLDFSGMVFTRATDGKIAWGTNFQTGGMEELPEQEATEFKRNALGYDSLLNPKKYGITFALKGKKQIEGKDYLVLEQTYADGHKATHYIDSKTYLIYKSVTTAQGMMGGEVEEETFLSDYKKVNGVMISHTMTVLQGGEQFLTMSYTEVKLNTGLEDSLFKPLFPEGRSRQV
jgi:outer membrane lipoprotein-sorting protein